MSTKKNENQEMFEFLLKSGEPEIAMLVNYIDELESENEELRNKFQIQKDCKNEAYNFILSNNYLDEFAAFKHGQRKSEPMKIPGISEKSHFSR